MSRRLRPDVLQSDRNALVALAAMKDYAPRNDAYSVAKAVAAEEAMESSQDKLIRIRAELAAAIDETARNEAAFHAVILGAKTEVVAQYGDSSDEVQALGLKKKSERKRPTRRMPKADG